MPQVYLTGSSKRHAYMLFLLFIICSSLRFWYSCVLLMGFQIFCNKLLLGNRSPSQVPRLVLPNELFVSIGRSLGTEVNRGLQFLQDVACGGNLKQFLVVGF